MALQRVCDECGEPATYPTTRVTTNFATLVAVVERVALCDRHKPVDDLDGGSVLDRDYCSPPAAFRGESITYFWPSDEAVTRDEDGIETIAVPAEATDCEWLIIMGGVNDGREHSKKSPKPIARSRRQ